MISSLLAALVKGLPWSEIVSGTGMQMYSHWVRKYYPVVVATNIVTRNESYTNVLTLYT